MVARPWVLQSQQSACGYAPLLGELVQQSISQSHGSARWVSFIKDGLWCFSSSHLFVALFEFDHIEVSHWAQAWTLYDAFDMGIINVSQTHQRVLPTRGPPNYAAMCSEEGCDCEPPPPPVADGYFYVRLCVSLLSPPLMRPHPPPKPWFVNLCGFFVLSLFDVWFVWFITSSPTTTEVCLCTSLCVRHGWRVDRKHSHLLIWCSLEIHGRG